MSHRTYPTLPCLAAILAALLTSPPCLAAGAWLSETGGADMGMAGAGRAALALDASALSANPAALGALTESSATVALLPLRLDYRFEGATSTRVHATNHAGTELLPAAYAAHRDGDWAYGLGAWSSFGLSFDSGDGWGGQRVVESAGVETLNVAPALAWRASDRWQVGASLGAQWARPRFECAVASDAAYFGPPTGLPDGHLQLSGDSWAPFGQLGVTYESRQGTRAGLSWTAPVAHSVPLGVDARDVHPVLGTLLPRDGDVRVDFNVPQQLLLGLSHELRNGTTLAAGASWQDWSAFGEARQKGRADSSRLFPYGLRDTWGASLGVRHRFDDRWSAAAGVDYESSPAPSGGLPAYFPVGEQWKLAAGLERRASEAVRLRGELSATLQGDARVTPQAHPLPLPGIPPLAGTYQDTRVYMVALAADFVL